MNRVKFGLVAIGAVFVAAMASAVVSSESLGHMADLQRTEMVCNTIAHQGRQDIALKAECQQLQKQTHTEFVCNGYGACWLEEANR